MRAGILKVEFYMIGGGWVPAKSGQAIDVLNSATGELLKRTPRGDAGDIADARGRLEGVGG